MNEHIARFSHETASVDLSRFERITVLSDEAWRKPMVQKKMTTVKLPLSLQRIEKSAFDKCLQLREVEFRIFNFLAKHRGISRISIRTLQRVVE
jgi:hypothetical protein